MLALLLFLLLATPVQAAMPLLDFENTHFGSPVNGADVTSRNGVAYVAADNRFFTWNISNPSNALALDFLPMFDAQGLDVSGNIAFVADLDSLHTVNVSNPANISLLDTINMLEAVDVVVNPVTLRAYVANTSPVGDISVVSYANPSNLSTIAVNGAVTNPQALVLEGSRLFLADGNGGLRIFNVTNPVPVQTGSFSNGRFYVSVDVFQGFIYLVDSSFGLTVLEDTGGNPILRAQRSITGSPQDVRVECPRAYVVTDSSTGQIHAFDVTNPLNPGVPDITSIGGVASRALDVDGDVVITTGTSLSPKLALFDADAFCQDFDGDGVCRCGDPCPDFANTTPLPIPGGVGDENADGIPNECQCGEYNNDGAQNGFDSLGILNCGAFAVNCEAVPALGIPAGVQFTPLWDTNGDGVLNGFDSLLVLTKGADQTQYELTCERRPGLCSGNSASCLGDIDCNSPQVCLGIPAPGF